MPLVEPAYCPCDRREAQEKRGRGPRVSRHAGHMLYPENAREADERKHRSDRLQTLSWRQIAAGALNDLSAATERTHGTPNTAEQERQDNQDRPPDPPDEHVRRLTNTRGRQSEAGPDD